MTRHGKSSTYNAGCRCPNCRAANTAAKARWRARRTGRLAHYTPPGRTHGIRATYTRGCRCTTCKAAEALYRNQYRRRKAAA